MGFFTKTIRFISPLKGELCDVSQSQDKAFSKKFLGDGLVIFPSDGDIFAPVTGRVIQIFHTKHAILIKSENLEVLLHIGINTDSLNGEGFEYSIKDGDDIVAGNKIGHVDLEFLKSKNYSTETTLVVTNIKRVVSISKRNGFVEGGKDLAMIVKV